MINTIDSSRVLRTYGPLLLALTCGFIAYLPVAKGDFVWADRIFLHETSWLSMGDNWLGAIFQRYPSGGRNYFRPLPLALLALQSRAFGDSPGAMHMVSLALHLANTCLVWLLTRTLCNIAFGRAAPAATAVSALYAIHPALVEPVAYIASQSELIFVLFLLVALLLNLAIRNTVARAFAVGAFFLFAALSKEAALSVPLLVLLCDWAVDGETGRNLPERLRSMFLRRWPVYLALVMAGVAYLSIRWLSLGYLLADAPAQVTTLEQRLQLAASTYITYWRLILLPFVDIGPTHVVDFHSFRQFSPRLLAFDLFSLTVIGAGIVLTLRRKRAGYAVLAMTVALLPVLHLVPVAFDSSFFHERYATLALAVFFPFIGFALAAPARTGLSGNIKAVLLLTCSVWSIAALATIHVTAPLWSSERTLWSWELKRNPDSMEAKNHLLSTYIDTDDLGAARTLSRQLVEGPENCFTCFINIAHLAFVDANAGLAAKALDRAEKSLPPGDARALEALLLVRGENGELQHDLTGAEAAYRDAIALDPFDPQARMNFALLLARTGRLAEARQESERSLAMFAPDKRAERKRDFDRAVQKAEAAHAAEAAQGD